MINGSPLLYIPLVFVFLLGIAMLLIPYSNRIEWFFSILARGLFAARVNAPSSVLKTERKQLLQAAQVASTYRSYAARTYLYSAFYGIIGSILGVYVIAGLFRLLAIPPATLSALLPEQIQFLSTIQIAQSLTIGQLLLLVLLSTSTLGLLFAYSTYQLRWWLLQNRADIRGRHIDKTLPAIVAFMYAMSRKGIPFSEIIHTLAENKDAYGAAAEDVENVSRDVDLYGEDLNNSLRRMARQTPSQQFEEFTHNLISVLQSRQNISTFLRNQYERYQEDLESQQMQFLSTLATLAEIYVSIFVVGFLLLITILVIVGLFGVGDTFGIVQLLVYIIIPLLNFVFILYLDSILGTETRSFIERDSSIVLAGLRNLRRSDDRTITSPITEDATEAENVRKRLELYHKIRSFKKALLSPKETLILKPEKIFYVTGPITAAIVSWTLLPYQDTLFSILTGSTPPFNWSSQGVEVLAAIDDTLILAGTGLIGSFAVAYHFHVKRTRQIDDGIADFLDRLASVNEAGMTVVESLHRLNQSTNDLGVLSTEVARTCRDIDWGADATTALYNLEQRAQTATMTRVVTLITNALRASGSISPVLRIAADEANNIRRLRKERHREMFTYMIVIYMSFFVFMIIIGALTEILIPGMPDVDTSLTIFAGSGNGPGAAAYTLLLYHTSIIQGLFAGLIAGQMGEGSIKAGTKHATILVLFTYLVFLLLL